MKIVRQCIAVFFVGILFAMSASSQTLLREYWNTAALAIPDNSPSVSSVINVPDAFTITDMQVVVNIQHPTAGDLVIKLISPSATIYTLSTNNGGINANFDYTIFDNTGGYPGLNINDPTNQTAYFRGVYRPESTLPTTGAGQGTWTLVVQDNFPVNSGTLLRWGLIFNQSHKYRDIRWGADLNGLISQGICTSAAYPTPWLDDITAYPPMSVIGLRPWGNLFYYAPVYQSKDAVPTRFSVQAQRANSAFAPREDYDQSLSTGANGFVGGLTLGGTAGTQLLTYSLYQRADVFGTHPDNDKFMPLNTTMGSMGYDNGTAANTFDPGVLECNANVYWLPTNQSMRLTSVDIWQGDGVELDPKQAGNWQISIRVYSAGFGTAIGTFGPYPLAPQGNKWVTYAVPPTYLAPGEYAFAACIDARPGVGGGTFDLGVDQRSKPFQNPLSSLSRLAGFGIQYYNIDPATQAWSEEVDRDYAVKMIRPNFNEGTDLGVVQIVTPGATIASGTFQPEVVFGSYCPFPPNIMNTALALARVYFYDATTNNLVAYTEKRVTMHAPATPYVAPYAYYSGTESFPSVTLPAGTYNMTVNIERSDDENLVNNSYTRTFTRLFAPIVISHNGAMSKQMLDNITSGLKSQGFDPQFVDRSIVNELPNGNVLWYGDIDAVNAARLRTLAEQGNYVAIVTPENVRSDFRTSVFSSIANSAEANDMNTTLARAGKAIYVEPAQNPFLDQLASGQVPILSKDEQMTAQITDFNKMFASHIVGSKAARLNKAATSRQLAFTRSGDLEVVANNIGSVSVVEVRVPKTNAVQHGVESAVNPTEFSLSQNFPNPFNPTTNIMYNLPVDASINIRVFDLLGREVSVLANMTQKAGQYSVIWNGRNNAGLSMSTGIYLYRMEARPLDGSAPFVSTRKMVLAK